MENLLAQMEVAGGTGFLVTWAQSANLSAYVATLVHKLNASPSAALQKVFVLPPQIRAALAVSQAVVADLGNKTYLACMIAVNKTNAFLNTSSVAAAGGNGSAMFAPASGKPALGPGGRGASSLLAERASPKTRA